MKTVLAALVLSAFAVAPAAAGPTYALRGIDDAALVRAEAKADASRAATVEAPPAKKVRVVLASPYGN